MKFTISYKLEEHGWAIINISNGNEIIERPVSYLHDSLLELAEMALQIKSGISESITIFMDEPGEIQLRIITNNNEATYEVRSYKDWASWGMHSFDDYELLLKGTTTPTRIIQQITKVLWEINKNIGPEKYKELWCEHEFPKEQYNKLANA